MLVEPGTVTTRFCVPAIFLEGRPALDVGWRRMGMARVVKTKFWLASMMSLGCDLRPSSLLSCHLLKMSWTGCRFLARSSV